MHLYRYSRHQSRGTTREIDKLGVAGLYHFMEAVSKVLTQHPECLCDFYKKGSLSLCIIRCRGNCSDSIIRKAEAIVRNNVFSIKKKKGFLKLTSALVVSNL